MALMGQDRMEILELLSDGKITVEEAERLLSDNKADAAISNPPQQIEPIEDEVAEVTYEKAVDDVTNIPDTNSGQPKWFHVKVSDLKTGKGKVTVNIPLNLVRAGLNLGGRYSKDLAGFEWNELSSVIAGEKGVLVDVEDEEDGEHVQIYLD